MQQQEMSEQNEDLKWKMRHLELHIFETCNLIPTFSLCTGKEEKKSVGSVISLAAAATAAAATSCTFIPCI